ncbi:helix-turn-helix transcriptional regulator [Streptomyces albus subsp. chlorinus]|uniref:helix-turn-helix domain-containing protein n=1 Tax=Streptomyces albus TaxID=1888 RepID=UPI00156FDD21|nr:helix-turn-helix transcriptional regulator [Streptomyces albus]NSC21325.1 helix-turn-helix transcriptional regulator [Streptomyces albus subsp. chlorinus]
MRLSERRKAMGYSQEKFAHALGVDRTTVGRWERGETTPECVHRPKMAELLRLDITELGRMLDPPPAHHTQPPAQPLPRPVHGPGESDEMIRRKFLRLLTVTGALTALGPEAADDIAEAAERGSADDYRRMNDHLWQVYQLARSKRSVHGVVQDQLDALADALKTGSSSRAAAMCEAAGDLFQLSGELAFDSNRYTDAAAAYSVAASASDSAHAFDLWACALVRHAYVDMSERQFTEATETLEVARTIATRGDPALSTRYWVASVQAEAHANLGDMDACQRALDEAQKVTDLPGPVHNGGWLRFDGSRLPEERGARFVQLGRLDLAEKALKSALDSTALAKGTSYRRRGSVLVDLALIGAKRHDAEQAVTHGREALQLARQSGSGYIARRLQTLRDDLRSYGHDHRIAELAADIGSLHAT